MVGPSPELLNRFEGAFRQAAFCAALNTVNADPQRPRIHGFGRYEHQIGDQSVPGSRAGHPNPDYLYRFVPVDGASTYLIRGKALGRPPTAVEFGVINQEQQYISYLSKDRLVVDPDGSFEIVVGPEARLSGAPNQLKTRSDAFRVLIRDMLGDLSTQSPHLLSVERIEGPGSHATGESAPAESYEGELTAFIDDVMWVNENLVFKREPNIFEPPGTFNDTHYSPTQAYSAGHYRIANDEALVMSLTLGGAAYAVVPITDHWGGLGDVLAHTVSVGTGYAAPGPDGRFTFVIAMTDPHVQNWVDPDGLHEGVIFVRWVGLPVGGGAATRPTLTARVVRLSEVEQVVGPGLPRFSLARRQRQIAERRRHYLNIFG